jgi:uncharacterized Zn finger protein
MSDQLSSVLNEAVIERLASPRSFGRGVGYFEEGRVGPLRTGVGRVSATVQGAADYAVKLCAGEDSLRRAAAKVIIPVPEMANPPMIVLSV